MAYTAGPWGVRRRGRSARRRRGRAGFPRLVVVGFAFGVLVAAASERGVSDLLDRAGDLMSHLAPARDLVATVVPGGEEVRVGVPMCGSGVRHSCLVDGDTLWLHGEKVRIADIDTPEVFSPKCAAEAELGARATRRMHDLLNRGPFTVHRAGLRDVDRYGRRLRVIRRDGRSLGDVLVAEGLARRWTGARRSWCA